MTTTTVHTPIQKLYKRCAWGKHAQCPGKFEDWSECVCDCHSPAAQMTDAERIVIGLTETLAAIKEAEAITAPPGIAAIFSGPTADQTRIIRELAEDRSLTTSEYAAAVEQATGIKSNLRRKAVSQSETTGIPGPDLKRNAKGGLIPRKPGPSHGMPFIPYAQKSHGPRLDSPLHPSHLLAGEELEVYKRSYTEWAERYARPTLNLPRNHKRKPVAA